MCLSKSILYKPAHCVLGFHWINLLFIGCEHLSFNDTGEFILKRKEATLSFPCKTDNYNKQK